MQTHRHKWLKSLHAPKVAVNSIILTSLATFFKMRKIVFKKIIIAEQINKTNAQYKCWFTEKVKK